MFSRTRHRIQRLNPFAGSRGLKGRDYLLAALSNPREFLRALRRSMGRRARMFEAVARLAETADLNRPAPGLPPQPRALADVLAGLAQRIGVLDLGPCASAGAARIGVADTNLLSAVYDLLLSNPSASLTLDGDKADLGMNKIKARLLAARAIDIGFIGPACERLSITVEQYQKIAPGKWQSTNPSNRLLRAVYSDLLDEPGLTRALDILGAPTLPLRAQMDPVDAVFTWVNHADPDWQALFAAWRPPAQTGPGRWAGDTTQSAREGDAARGADDLFEAPAGASGDSDTLSRFHNNDELRYALRALDRNLPWLRQIFILSNCAPPDWLATDHPRLIWLRHEAVIPSGFLPSFSSHVIESFLHLIPGLADRFLYFNDDFFVMRALSKTDFFTETGQSLARLEGYGMVSGAVREGDPDYLNAARNSAALLREALGFAPSQLHQHVPYALHRPVLAEIETRFRGPIDAFRSNRFRKSNDLNIPSFLYHHYAMGCGQALNLPAKSLLVKSNDLRWRERLREAASQSHDFVCINEGGAEAAPAGWHRAVRQFLEIEFPQACAWEIAPQPDRQADLQADPQAAPQPDRQAPRG